MYKIIATNADGKKCSFTLTVNRVAPNLIVGKEYMDEVKVSEVDMVTDTKMSYQLNIEDGSTVDLPSIGSYTNPISGVVTDIILLDGKVVLVPANESLIKYNDVFQGVIYGITLGSVIEYSEKHINGYSSAKEDEPGILALADDYTTVKPTLKHKVGMYLISGVKYGGQIPPRVAKIQDAISLYDKNTPVSILLSLDTKMFKDPLMHTAALYSDGTSNRITKSLRKAVEGDAIFAINP